MRSATFAAEETQNRTHRLSDGPSISEAMLPQLPCGGRGSPRPEANRRLSNMAEVRVGDLFALAFLFLGFYLEHYALASSASATCRGVQISGWVENQTGVRLAAVQAPSEPVQHALFPFTIGRRH